MGAAAGVAAHRRLLDVDHHSARVVAAMTDHVLDEARFFDAETGEWGYVVICCEPTHAPCPAERELFRFRDEVKP